MKMNDLQRMKQEYNDLLEDINAVDKSQSIISKHFKGTGTLQENELYMLGLTCNIDLSTDTKLLLMEYIQKKETIIKDLQDRVSIKNLRKYTYTELLYLIAGIYTSTKGNNNEIT